MIAPVEENGVPAPEGGCSGHDDGKNDKEIFVGNSGYEWVEDSVAAEKAD